MKGHDMGERGKGGGGDGWNPTHHLQRPNPPYPNLQPPFYTLDLVQLHAFPPTSPRRLPPKQEQLLRHAHRVVVRQRLAALDVGPEAREGEAADDGLVGLAGAVAPAVLVVEAAGRQHLDQMLLRRARLLAPSQPRKYAVLLQ